jgi:hypothetical protein
MLVPDNTSVNPQMPFSGLIFAGSLDPTLGDEIIDRENVGGVLAVEGFWATGMQSAEQPVNVLTTNARQHGGCLMGAQRCPA